MVKETPLTENLEQAKNTQTYSYNNTHALTRGHTFICSL